MISEKKKNDDKEKYCLVEKQGATKKKAGGRHGKNGNNKLPAMIIEKGKGEEKNDDKDTMALISNYQNRAEAAEAALLDFKASLHSILNMSDNELKAICKEKNIKIFGKAAMKHKYTFAILTHLV